MAGCVTDLSREVGGLSHADAEPPKSVPLVATTVPDGGGLTALAGEILRDPRTGKIGCSGQATKRSPSLARLMTGFSCS